MGSNVRMRTQVFLMVVICLIVAGSISLVL
jgi:hypothetical protein